MQELEREASQDPLTGLKNRRRFEEDLRTTMARGRRERTTGALLMLDLDHFKQVNDTHRPPGRRPADPSRSPTCCAAAVARATCWRDSAATSSPSSCPAAARRGTGGRRVDRRGDPPAPAQRRCRAAHRQRRGRDVRRPTRGPASTRSSPRRTRRCTRPRTAVATECGSSTRSRSATTSPGRLRATAQLASQVEHALGRGLERRAVQGAARGASAPAPARRVPPRPDR